MSFALVVQTCDRYEPFWDGFFHFMQKQWSKDIDCGMYFCNEKRDISLPTGFRQIKTGEGTFVQNLNSILSEVEEEHVFYMLEDFWPTAPMSKSLLFALYDQFCKNDLDALQVSNYTPYYEIEEAGTQVDGQRMLSFRPESEWIFNFQARFWKKSSMKMCLVEPEISEKAVSSAITVEMASDISARQNLSLKVWLYHYFWYPIGGVAYRGKLTEIGEQMQNIVNIEKFVSEKFNLQVSSQE